MKFFIISISFLTPIPAAGRLSPVPQAALAYPIIPIIPEFM